MAVYTTSTNRSLWSALKPSQYGDVPTEEAWIKNAWRSQAAMYSEMWDYFLRAVFDEMLDDRSNIRKYPLGVNLFETACTNHRACLFGEFEGDVLNFRVTTPKQKNADAGQVETKLEQIWIESGRNSILLEGGLLAMILGGVVYRPIWNPWHRKTYVRMISPDAWLPIWDENDYHTILECYVSFMTDIRTAMRKYNVNITDKDAEVEVHVLEHWTPDFYEVTVDGKEAYWDRGHQFPMSGSNPYKDPITGRGIIPFEYFPRDRAGSFYGIPLGKNALQLQNEYNSRLADLGDATLEATHKYLFARNLPHGTKGIKLERGTLINLGMTAPGQNDPEVTDISGGDVPAASVEYVEGLKRDTRTSMYTPAVSYGEDEGSQRSALTLAFRMWPLTQALRATRGFWTDSFYHLNRKTIIVTASHEKNGYDLELRHADYRFVPTWAPMLPRDRSQEVNEIVVRKQTGLISTRHAVEVLEDRETEFVEEEVKRIDEDKQREVELMSQMAMAGGGGNQPMQGGSIQTRPMDIATPPPKKVPDS